MPPWTSSLSRPLASIYSMPCHHAARSLRPCLDQRHSQPDGGVGCTSDNRGLSLGSGSALHDPRPGSHLRYGRHTPTACHGHSGQAYCSGLTLAEQLCRAVDRINPARVFGSPHCFGRGTSAPDSEKLCGLLQRRENASISKQRCAGLTPGSAIRLHKFRRPLGRTSSPLRSGLSFRHTHLLVPCGEHAAVLSSAAAAGTVTLAIEPAPGKADQALRQEDDHDDEDHAERDEIGELIAENARQQFAKELKEASADYWADKRAD